MRRSRPPRNLAEAAKESGDLPLGRSPSSTASLPLCGSQRRREAASWQGDSCQEAIGAAAFFADLRDRFLVAFFLAAFFLVAFFVDLRAAFFLVAFLAAFFLVAFLRVAFLAVFFTAFRFAVDLRAFLAALFFAGAFFLAAARFFAEDFFLGFFVVVVANCLIP